MCGIVGYVGDKDITQILINGLSKLEYRGYDSAGIVVHDGKKLNILKTKGRLNDLEEKLKSEKISGNSGIGHTRWATHGSPSDLNSHPIYSYNNTIAVVHNGIIENYMQLKEELELKGYEFRTETDTEAVANLIDFYYTERNFLEAVFKAIERIEGSYALGIVCLDFPDKIIAARKDSPLIIGLSENENFIASDVPAILNYTRKIHFLDDREVAEINREEVIVYKNGKVINKEIVEVDLDMDAAEKGNFKHFMLKEMYEQPKVIKDTLTSRLKEDGVQLDDIKLTKKELENINKIYIVACGSASYAGLVGKSLIEKKVRIPVISEIASEFRYNDPIIDNKTLIIAVSQSGETADTLASIRLAKSKGARVLAIVNVVGSSIAREADDIFYTLAGPEIAVASTKAFSAQVVAMFLLTIHIGMELSKISVEEYKELKSCLEELPKLSDIVIQQQYTKMEEMAKKYLKSKNIFYIGRGIDYVITLEGSLKLKELAYLHSESYAAGELKHGPIALMENDSLVVGVVTQENIFDKTASNISQCRSRGASVLAIAMEGSVEIEKHCDDVIYIPRTHQLFAPLLANIPQQLFAYFIAIGLGNDVDKPRNLAKSVTVE